MGLVSTDIHPVVKRVSPSSKPVTYWQCTDSCSPSMFSNAHQAADRSAQVPFARSGERSTRPAVTGLAECAAAILPR